MRFIQEEDNRMNVGEIIKKIKYDSELTQAEIGKILGCSQVTISRIRRGLQFPNTGLLLKMIKLANKYNIKITVDDVALKDKQ